MTELLTLIPWALGIITLLLGFFLRRTMGDLDDTSELANAIQNKVNLLELELKHTNSKVDEIFTMLKEISTDIKEINKSISNR